MYNLDHQSKTRYNLAVRAVTTPADNKHNADRDRIRWNKPPLMGAEVVSIFMQRNLEEAITHVRES